MLYMKQLGIILAITTLGDILSVVLPFPIPGSLYGLALMLYLLISGILKPEKVETVGLFLVEIMPFMFIPAAVGLIASWDSLRPILFRFLLIIMITTFSTLVISGKMTDYLLKGGEKDDPNHS